MLVMDAAPGFYRGGNPRRAVVVDASLCSDISIRTRSRENSSNARTNLLLYPHLCQALVDLRVAQ
jgi:hypothetical protein